MKDSLSAEQIAQYRQQGFIAIEGFLNPAELTRWREATDDAVAKRLADKGWHALNNQGEGSDDYYKQVFVQCLKLADSHAGMHELIFDERLGRLAGTLAGVDGIRIWHDQALIKPPYGNPTAWHLDNPYWSFSSRNSISIWIALDDATLMNGCMAYLPGTHLTARHDNAGIGSTFGGLFNVYPEWKKMDATLVPVPAGSAVLHNGLTAHGAGVNMTSRPRRAMTCAYMPDGSTFNGQKNVLPEDYFQSLKPGDPLQDNRITPLIWQRK